MVYNKRDMRWVFDFFFWDLYLCDYISAIEFWFLAIGDIFWEMRGVRVRGMIFNEPRVELEVQQPSTIWRSANS